MITLRARMMAALLGLLLPLWTMAIMAAPVTRDEARGAAERFLNKTQAGRQKPASNNANVHLTAAETDFIGAAAGKLYVFDINRDSKAGYVIVSGDSDYGDVLGWTDRGNFDKDNVPPALLFLLNVYAEEMELGVTPKSAERTPDIFQREPIAPLTKSKWDQDYPYNAQCPVITLSSGNFQAPSGCVATAFSQLMYFHKWPANGTGTYKDIDFGNTTYEWDKMHDEYEWDKEFTEEEVNAISTLMSHVGVAMDTSYGPFESSAYSSKAVKALYEHFGYNLGSNLQRNYCNSYEFLDAVYRELQHGRPVMYEGRDSNGGHQFICDGYEDGMYFHINWGWSGFCDGWYKLTALNPSVDGQGIGSNNGTYNDAQGIWTCITPNKSGETLIHPWGVLTSFSSSENSIHATIEFDSLIKQAYTADVALMCVNTADGTQTIVPWNQIETNPSGDAGGYYVRYHDVSIGLESMNGLPEGTYRVYIVAKNCKSVDEWSYFVFKTSTQITYKLIEVKNGHAQIIDIPEAKWDMDVHIGDTHYMEQPLDISIDFSAEDSDVDGESLQLRAINVQTGQYVWGNISLKILAGETTTIRPEIIPTKSQVTAGTFKLTISRKTGTSIFAPLEQIYESEEFEVMEGTSGSPELTLSEPYTLIPRTSVQDKMRVDAKLKCDGGRYVDNIYLCFISYDAKGVSEYVTEVPIKLVVGNGETVQVSQEIDLTGLNLKPDEVYETRFIDRNFFPIMPWKNNCVEFCYDARTIVDLTENSTQVPDAAFRKFLHDEYDIDNDYRLTNLEMNSISNWKCSTMSVEDEAVRSIAGVEYFKKLQQLSLSDTKVEYLSVTAEQPIEELYLWNNKLRKIDFDKVPRLERLFLYTNCLVALELPKDGMTLMIGSQKRGVAFDENGDYDLGEFEQDGFKSSRVKETHGISFADGKIHIDDLQASNVWYTYDAGYGKELYVEIYNTNAPKLSQEIVWQQNFYDCEPESYVYLWAYATSGLPVSYELLSGPGSLEDNCLYIADYGTFEIRATQGGNEQYLPAEPVTVKFRVSIATKEQQIVWEQTSSEFEPGKQTRLTAYATSGLPVSYELLEGPATIEGDIIMIHDYGTFEIRASQDGDDEYKPAWPVTIYFRLINTNVESITLDYTELQMSPGDKILLHATVMPESIAEEFGVSWWSNNDAVAIVSDEGLVTAIAEGNAVINVFCFDEMATCHVTVKQDVGIVGMVSDEDADAEYFTLEGHRIASKELLPGIYLKRIRNKVEKVLVR